LLDWAGSCGASAIAVDRVRIAHLTSVGRIGFIVHRERRELYEFGRSGNEPA